MKTVASVLWTGVKKRGRFVKTWVKEEHPILSDKSRREEKMQMHQQRQRTGWGTGMNPTGHYAHMFEEDEKRKFIQTTTEILKKK
jgi:hypothetical protein